ncbi:MAG: lysylphosphatidylglycerol synthase transmembrane domain-containing protein [Reyranella sp.]|nr:lysylphosphatidylglycerol synthase transmembrane domain-containing protein [Reyranella sp.]MDP3161097.1 lysylphosphatidylglycerol synthase transmembrane domain-containing protein [Reyranella sp.]
MILSNIGVRTAISVLVLCAAVAYLVARDECCSMDSNLLLATAALQPVNMLVIATVGWRFILLAHPPRPTFWSSLKASTLATGLNIIAPARGGDFIRLTYLRQREGTPLGIGLSISIIERVADLIVLSAMAIIVASLVLQSKIIVPIVAISALGVGLIILSALLPLWLAILRRIFPAAVAAFLTSVTTETAARIRDGKIFLALAASALYMGLGLVATLIFFRIATEQEFSLTLAAMVLVFASLGGAIPILPGGLATFEAGVIAALMYGGYSASDALKLAVVYRLQQYVLATPLALLVASRERVGLSAMFSEMFRLLTNRRMPPDLPPTSSTNENH